MLPGVKKTPAGQMREEVVFYRATQTGGVDAPAAGARNWAEQHRAPAKVTQKKPARWEDGAALRETKQQIEITTAATTAILSGDIAVWRNIAARVIMTANIWENQQMTITAELQSDNASEFMSA